MKQINWVFWDVYVKRIARGRGLTTVCTIQQLLVAVSVRFSECQQGDV